ncbi:MAG: patatin-like phospholipase family protein [Burkholderiales bacterium]
MARKLQFPMRPGTRRVALVLQGGGALGSYQAGVFQALDEHGLTPDWVGGTSIGAINGAIIAGNPPGLRVERLKQFWNTIVQEDPLVLRRMPDAVRQAFSFWTAMAAFVAGRPRFFSPHPFLPFWMGDTGTAEATSFYDTRPLGGLLPELVDFDYLNNGAIRFSLGAVHVTSGRLRYFDNAFQRIGVEHILASSALPPAFPPVRVDGELYWDGGLYSNTPLDVVLDDYPRVNTLCFMIDLWSADGNEPRSISETLDRQKDIMYASRSDRNIETYQALHNLRRVIRELYGNLPEAKRKDPEMRKLAERGCHTIMDIVHLGNRSRDWELASKDVDFSRTAIDERWQLGHADAMRVLQRAAWMDPLDPRVGVVVHQMPGVTA